MVHLRRFFCFLVAGFFLVGWGISGAVAQDKANAAMERRIDVLLKKMTLQEKAGQLSAYAGDSPQTAAQTTALL
jgi:hypothetical protein